MGIRDWFKGNSDTLSLVQAPSAEYPTARAAIEAIVRAHPKIGESGDWLTFEAGDETRSAIIEIGDHRANFGTTRVDLPAVLRDAGLDALAECVRPAGRNGNDPTLWLIDDASPEELTEIVDFAFTRVFGLGPSYRVNGRHQR